MHRLRRVGCVGLIIASAPLIPAHAQTAQAQTAQSQTAQSQTAQSQTAQSQPLNPAQPLSLDEAIRLAEANEPTFAAAFAEGRATALERKDARAALLPSATFHNQYLFTESNHTHAQTTETALPQSLPVFIANNAVHEYYSQGVVNETIGLAQFGAIKLADANAARAEAELEVARRGLVQTVVGLFYGSGAANQKLIVAETALDEANRFLDITTKREQGREAAHADVIKARLGSRAAPARARRRSTRRRQSTP